MPPRGTPSTPGRAGLAASPWAAPLQCVLTPASAPHPTPSVAPHRLHRRAVPGPSARSTEHLAHLAPACAPCSSFVILSYLLEHMNFTLLPEPQIT